MEVKLEVIDILTVSEADIVTCELSGALNSVTLKIHEGNSPTLYLHDLELSDVHNLAQTLISLAKKYEQLEATAKIPFIPGIFTKSDSPKSNVEIKA